MPELPEGTINAFIQNKNLAKYGLLKDNEGGFLAENFVDAMQLIFTATKRSRRSWRCHRRDARKDLLGPVGGRLASWETASIRTRLDCDLIFHDRSSN